ncbi:MAG TPA: T9SS type A sorting domain-containing protein [Bacteroidia bacterium]
MKKRIYYLFVLLLPMLVRAQDSAFVRTYGGVNMDIGRDVKETPDHGFVVAGTTSSFGQGNTSMYLVKTDSMGIHKWSKNYGGLNSDWAYSIETTMDNGFLLSGFSNSFSSNYDPYVVKTDAGGNLLWEKIYGTDDWDFVYGSTLLPDSGFVLCGETYGNSIGGSDGYVIRIDKMGNQVWAAHVGTTTDDKLYKIIYLNNTLYAVGSTRQNGYLSGMLAKIDLAGNVAPLFVYDYAPASNQELACITVNSTSQLVMGGHVNPDNITGTNDWLLKTDTMGTVVFSYSGTAGPTGLKRFEDIVCVEFDEIVTSGISTGGNGGLGLFMVRFDANGLYIAADNFGSFYDDYGHAVTLTQNKHLAFVGSTKSFGCGDEDMYLIMNRNQHFVANSKLNNKYYCDTLGLVVVDLKKTTVTGLRTACYPNPFSDKLTIDIQGDIVDHSTFYFELKDMQGRAVYTSDIAAGSTELLIQNIEAGMYFYAIYSGKEQVSSGKLIQQ